MKRLSVVIAVIAVVAAGSLTSACNVTPNAASVNGDSISVATLNSQMRSLSSTGAGQCLLDLRSSQVQTEGSGGPGTYVTGFAGAVLSSSVGNLVAAQYAAAHGIHLTGSDLATAQNNYVSTLDGGITGLVQQATASGAITPCQKSDGTAYTGQQLLAALPADLRNNELANQAVDNKLLSRGADLSNAAVLNYYAANQPLFIIDCVSDITTTSQAAADGIVNKLDAGASFSQLATSSSADAQTASQGGQLGCNFTESRVLQALQLTSVTVGKPVTPIQTSSGSWVVYEVTSQTVVPVAQAASVIRQDLLHTAANTQRVTSELLVFAHRSSITVNPQYGTWMGVRITPPTPPPARYLQPAAALAGALTGSPVGSPVGSATGAATGAASSTATGG